jgi:hypothetical protein
MPMNSLAFPVSWSSVPFDQRNVYSTYRREAKDVSGPIWRDAWDRILTSGGLPEPNSMRAVSTWSNIIGGR